VLPCPPARAAAACELRNNAAQDPRPHGRRGAARGAPRRLVSRLTLVDLVGDARAASRAGGRKTLASYFHIAAVAKGASAAREGSAKRAKQARPRRRVPGSELQGSQLGVGSVSLPFPRSDRGALLCKLLNTPEHFLSASVAPALCFLFHHPRN
jgi:hypothetical protein